MTAKAFSNLKSVTRGIFKYAKRKKFTSIRIDDVIDDLDIARKSFSKSNKDDSEQSFSDEEFIKLARYFKGKPTQHNLGLLLMFATGLRGGEISTLKKDDYDGKSLYVQRTESRYQDEDGKVHFVVKDSPKTEKGRRYAPVPDNARWILDRLFTLDTDSEWLFTTYSGNNKSKGKVRSITKNFRYALYVACDAVGIKRRGLHCIRKTYASILLDNNLPEKFITDNLGHVDIRVTKDYYSKQRKTIDQRTSILNQISEFKVLGDAI
jgi:integrase